MKQNNSGLAVVGVKETHKHTLISTKIENKKSCPEKVNLVIYHANCPDGFAGAFAAYLLLGKTAEYVPVPQSAEKDLLAPDVTGKHVAIIDFSFSAGKMAEILQQAASMIVLDHHVSAEANLVDIPLENKVFENRQSGCTLAWNFFQANFPIPDLFRYIEDKDIWRWAMENSAEFDAAWSLVPLEFDAMDVIYIRGEEGIRDQMRMGHVLIAYRNLLIERHVKSAVDRRLMIAPGWRTKVVNATVLISEIGNALAHAEDCDCAVMWSFDHEKGKFRVSMRSDSDEIDVSKVCVLMGGGGHKRAAAFNFHGLSIEELFIAPQKNE